MPCSSPKHAPLHFRSRLLRPLRLFSHSGSAGLRWKGKKEKKNRPESSNERKRTCSRIKSYFDPSVGSDWGSLMSICLAGISLAPGNPTGFLRIGEDSKVVRLELWRDTHSVAASTRVNTWWFCVCVSVCVGCVCEVQGFVSRCRQGQALGMGNGVHACTKCSRELGGVLLVWGTRSSNSFSVNQNNHASHTKTDNTLIMNTMGTDKQRVVVLPLWVQLRMALWCIHGWWFMDK